MPASWTSYSVSGPRYETRIRQNLMAVLCFRRPTYLSLGKAAISGYLGPLPREFSLKDFIHYPAQRVSPGSISFSDTLPEVLLSLLHMAEAELPEQNRLGNFEY